MVSGFLTSPCDHWRMSSAVARPMRSSSKKLTSSKISFFQISPPGILASSNSRRGPQKQRSGLRPLDLFDAAGLAPGQVDAELFRSAEDVLVGLAHLDGHAVAGEHLDVEAQ